LYNRNPYLQLLAVALWSMALVNTVEITGSLPIRISDWKCLRALRAACLSFRIL